MEGKRESQTENHDAIAQLAYQIWDQHGRPEGRDMEFWFEAERQYLTEKEAIALTPRKEIGGEKPFLATDSKSASRSRHANSTASAKGGAFRGGSAGTKMSIAANPSRKRSARASV